MKTLIFLVAMIFSMPHSYGEEMGYALIQTAGIQNVSIIISGQSELIPIENGIKLIPLLPGEYKLIALVGETTDGFGARIPENKPFSIVSGKVTNLGVVIVFLSVANGSLAGVAKLRINNSFEAIDNVRSLDRALGLKLKESDVLVPADYFDNTQDHQKAKEFLAETQVMMNSTPEIGKIIFGMAGTVFFKDKNGKIVVIQNNSFSPLADISAWEKDILFLTRNGNLFLITNYKASHIPSPEMIEEPIKPILLGKLLIVADESMRIAISSDMGKSWQLRNDCMTKKKIMGDDIFVREVNGKTIVGAIKTRKAYEIDRDSGEISIFKL